MNPIEYNQEYNIKQWENRHTVEYMEKWSADKVRIFEPTEKRKVYRKSIKKSA